MINDIFSQIEPGIGKSIYADDAAIWKRGRNVKFVQEKVQNAVNLIENWANKWGFRLSMAKTQVICFSKKKTNPTINIKM